MKFGSVVRVETLRHLTKITALRRKASKNKVLAAKHTASLQLLCTVGGSQATVDARAEFEISERSPKGGGEAGRATGCTKLHSNPKFLVQINMSLPQLSSHKGKVSI